MPVSEGAANFVASCFTGALVITLTNPLDTLKQRWQITTEGSPWHRPGMADFVRHIYRCQGMWGGLWAPGLGTNVCACVVSVGARIGVYPQLRDHLAPILDAVLQAGGRGAAAAASTSYQKAPSGEAGGDDGGTDQQGGGRGVGSGGGAQFLSGLAGGALGYVVSAPFFYASRVAQAAANDLELGVACTRASPNFGFRTLRALALNSVTGTLQPWRLWAGGGLLVARGAIMSATQLATYDLSKEALKEHVGLQDGPVVHTAASLAASVVLTTCICPLDVVLTTYQCGGTSSTCAVPNSSCRAKVPERVCRGVVGTCILSLLGEVQTWIWAGS